MHVNLPCVLFCHPLGPMSWAPFFLDPESAPTQNSHGPPPPHLSLSLSLLVICFHVSASYPSHFPTLSVRLCLDSLRIHARSLEPIDLFMFPISISVFHALSGVLKPIPTSLLHAVSFETFLLRSVWNTSSQWCSHSYTVFHCCCSNCWTTLTVSILFSSELSGTLYILQRPNIHVQRDSTTTPTPCLHVSYDQHIQRHLS